MRCPICGSKSKVIDSRIRKKENYIFRRRLCSECGNKFSSKEVIFEEDAFLKIKKESKKEAYQEIRQFLDGKIKGEL